MKKKGKMTANNIALNRDTAASKAKKAMPTGKKKEGRHTKKSKASFGGGNIVGIDC